MGAGVGVGAGGRAVLETNQRISESANGQVGSRSGGGAGDAVLRGRADGGVYAGGGSGVGVGVGAEAGEGDKETGRQGDKGTGREGDVVGKCSSLGFWPGCFRGFDCLPVASTGGAAAGDDAGLDDAARRGGLVPALALPGGTAAGRPRRLLRVDDLRRRGHTGAGGGWGGSVVAEARAAVVGWLVGWFTGWSGLVQPGGERGVVPGAMCYGASCRGWGCCGFRPEHGCWWFSRRLRWRGWGWRRQEAGGRRQEAGSRRQEAGGVG